MSKPKQKLTIKEQKFVTAKIQGKTNMVAYKEAGYKMEGLSAKTDASVVKNRPHVQKAIDDALMKHGLTPEYAIGQLAKIVAQDDEIGAKRLAIKDTLELHGWNKADRPTLQLDIKNAFFGGGRETDADQARHVENQE